MSQGLFNSRVVPFLVFLLAMEGGTGCTLIGTGAGASLPRYDSEATPPSQMGALGIGEEVEVNRASDDRWFRGTFGGIAGDELLVATRDGAVAIKLNDVASLHVRRGSYWLPGLLVGLAVDVVVVASYYALTR